MQKRERFLSALIPVFMAIAPSQADALKPSISIDVSSGGVSLGAYQGGYLYAQALSHPDSSQYRILTGASAGAINSLGGLYYCYHLPKSRWSPYRAWQDMGWQNLSRCQQKQTSGSAGALLDTKPIEAQLIPIIDSLLTPPDSGVAAPQAVWLGFATTRFFPRMMNRPLDATKMDEKIIIGIQWLDKSHPACKDQPEPKGCWRAWTEVDSAFLIHTPQLVLNFGAYGTEIAKIKRHLTDLALASSAFPVAFPRHPLELGLLDTGANAVHYQKFGRVWGDSAQDYPVAFSHDFNKADAHTFYVKWTGDPAHGIWKKSRYPTFSDGGLFENEPLNMARKIRDHLKARYPEAESLSSVRFVLPLRYDSLFMDTSVRQIRRGSISEWVLFLTERQPSATQIEVVHFLEEAGFSPNLLHLSKTSLPLAGEHLQHFSAFFRREFRDFDFAVGMHDAFLEYLGGESKSAKGEALKRLGNVNDTLKEQLEVLWDKIDRIYAEKKSVEDTTVQDSVQVRRRALRKLLGEMQDDLRAEIRARKTDPYDLNHFEYAMDGSFERLRNTFDALIASRDESDGDRFRSFSDGYRQYLPFTFLEREMSNSFYSSIRSLLWEDTLGAGNSILYPLVAYHARVGLGFFAGVPPAAHMAYARLDGSSQGFHLMQGIPFGSWPFGLELGERFMPNAFNVRHNAYLYLNHNFPRPRDRLRFLDFQSWWWLQIQEGVVGETTFNGRGYSLWPKMDIVILDAVVIGVDFIGKANPIEGHPMRDMWPPAFSVGTRVGFNLYSVMKGSLNGTNADRTEQR